MGFHIKTLMLQLLVTGLTLSSLILGSHRVHANPSCPSHFQALLKTAIEKNYPPTEFERIQNNISTRLDQIYQTHQELNNVNFLTRKTGRHYDLNLKQMHQIKELFEIMGIKSEIVLNKVKWQKKMNPLLMNKKIAELVIDTASLESHYPTLARAIKRAKISSPDGKAVQLKLKVNSLQKSLAHYDKKHEVVIVRDLDSILDVFVGGGYDSESVWHELMHAFFQKRFSEGGKNSVYDLAFAKNQPIKWLEHKNTYKNFMTAEEHYNHLNGMIWKLRNLKMANPEKMQLLTEEAKRFRYNVFFASEDWIKTFNKTKKSNRAFIQYDDLIHDKPDRKLMYFEDHNGIVLRLDPETSKNIKNRSEHPKKLLTRRLKKYELIHDESAKQQMKLISELHQPDTDYWLNLAKSDPERCRQELLKLHQKHFRFLKKWLYEPID